MSKFKKVLAQIDVLYKLALPELDKVMAAHKSAIQSEVAGGISAINSLFVSNQAAANSQGLQALDDYFGNLSGELANFPVSGVDPNVAKTAVDRLASAAGQVAFYTSKVNAGTGYDPLVYTGGTRSPGSYFDRVQTHIKNLSSYLQQNQAVPTEAPAPTVPPTNIS